MVDLLNFMNSKLAEHFHLLAFQLTMVASVLINHMANNHTSSRRVSTFLAGSFALAMIVAVALIRFAIKDEEMVDVIRENLQASSMTDLL